jgi:hypothetical protein
LSYFKDSVSFVINALIHVVPHFCASTLIIADQDYKSNVLSYPDGVAGVLTPEGSHRIAHSIAMGIGGCSKYPKINSSHGAPPTALPWAIMTPPHAGLLMSRC